MAMDVVTVAFEADCTMQTARIHFELDIPVPPNQAKAIKAAMDGGDWNSLKAQAKTFAPVAVSGALDFLISAAPQKQAPAKKQSNDTPKS
ncbi:hypothetical protein V5T82_13105 [Magnetovibrio sp. PR-2]|uniref:hypothetical protein n=1 Tax=Magnetovibrio sp. PR-2 TaxID=3120356 RepID=UPI002FCE4321